MGVGEDERDYAAGQAASSVRLLQQHFLDNLTLLVGENVVAKRDLADRDIRITELEEQLHASRAKVAAATVRVSEAPDNFRVRFTLRHKPS